MRNGNGDVDDCENDEERDSLDIEQVAMEIVKESLELGDKGPITSVEGECIECGDTAVWESPITGEKYCEYHAREHFTERHG